MALHQEVDGLLDSLPNIDVAALHRLADKIARDRSGDNFRTLREVVGNWLTDTVRRKAVEATGGLDRWFEVWEKTQRLFNRADGLNLDRKQLILNAFTLIEDAARS